MTPTFPLGVAASWARVVAVFVLDVALLAAGTAAAGRTGWWVGAALGLLVTVAALVRWRGCALLTLAWRLARRPSGTMRRWVCCSIMTVFSGTHRSASGRSGRIWWRSSLSTASRTPPRCSIIIASSRYRRCRSTRSLRACGSST